MTLRIRGEVGNDMMGVLTKHDGNWQSRILAASATLYERLAWLRAGGRVSDPIPSNADKRLSQWKRSATQGDSALFARRLAWDGILPEEASAICNGVVAPPLALSPSWAIDMLPFCIDALQDSSLTHEAEAFLDPANRLPFEDLFSPLVLKTVNTIQPYFTPLQGILSPPAKSSLCRQLLERLVQQSSKALLFEFRVFSSIKSSRLQTFLSPHEGSHALYDAFIKLLRQDGCRQFLSDYPVLARNIATLVTQWRDTTATFLERLVTDWPAILTTFQSDTSTSQVIAITPNLSDHHNGGQTVLRLTLNDGNELLYKPKNVLLESDFQVLLEEINGFADHPQFKTFRTLARQDYGWVERVRHAPCNSLQEVTNFYRSAGGLLALLYVLDATDCHHENLIAAGQFPFLVDVETIMHPRLVPQDLELVPGADALARHALWDSVLRTGMLPRWSISAAGNIYDLSALGATEEQALGIDALEWVNVNTDNMDLRISSRDVKPSENVPFLNNQVARPRDHLNSFLIGFAYIYRLLERQRDVLLLPDGPLVKLFIHHVRVVFRSTRVYSLLLEEATYPQYLRDGADSFFLFDSLARAFLSSEVRPATWAILRSEHSQMTECDVPWFSSCAENTSLILPRTDPILDVFIEPPAIQVSARLQALSEDDLCRQNGYIIASFASSGGPKTIHISHDGTTEPLDREDVQIAGEEYQDLAIELAHQVGDLALVSRDNCAAWLAYEGMPRDLYYQLQPAGFSLFSGTSGICLFLAAAAHVSKDQRLADLALAALRSLRNDVRGSVASILSNQGPGLGIGLGSVVYGMAAAGELLEEKSLLDDALAVTEFVQGALLESDTRYDMMGGVAGYLLAVMFLHGRRPHQRLVDQGRQCANHLLSMARRDAGDGLYWASSGTAGLTGFSHGTSGIAAALLSLHRIVGDNTLLAGAIDAFSYESLKFDSLRQNWLDLRFQENDGQSNRVTVTWCHGAPGIGLSRLIAMQLCPSDEIEFDIEVAINATVAQGIGRIDHVCCGNFGRIEFLMEAGRVLGRPDVIKIATQMAAITIKRAREQGGFRLLDDLPVGFQNPGLFQGISGIGYALLRLVEPIRFPSALTGGALW